MSESECVPLPEYETFYGRYPPLRFRRVGNLEEPHDLTVLDYLILLGASPSTATDFDDVFTAAYILLRNKHDAILVNFESLGLGFSCRA